MKVLLDIQRTLRLATGLLAAVFGANHASAVAYKASIISPPGYVTAEAAGVSGTSVVGLGNPASGELGAFLYNSAANSFVDLSPPNWAAQPHDVSGDRQVGVGSGPTTGGDIHAVLWESTAASLIDLNPTGYSYSAAHGISGNTQVGAGWGEATGGPVHALLWHGSAESVVELHPAGFTGSYANDVFESDVVGAGHTPQGTRALLWRGTAESVVNLHPAAYPESYATAVSEGSQVGAGIFSSAIGGERHALLWHGTAASVIDLHPAGFAQTDATGVAGSLQVGWGQGIATDGQEHALLWAGTAMSVVDLHSLLADLGPTFVNSFAHDIDANGVIVGSAGDGNASYAMMWTPVPEPASLGMCGLIFGAMLLFRPHATRSGSQRIASIWNHLV